MLRKKMLRDIRKNFSSFITIFIMTFLGVFVFSGIHAYMDGMDYSGQRYYEENNLQDLWMLGENFSDEDMKDILATDGVKAAERALVINTDLKNYKDVVLETNFVESKNISSMHVVDGEGFDYDSDGMWLDSYLADNLGIKVGDELTLAYKDYEIIGRVAGLVNTPDHVYSIKDESAIFPTHDDYGYVYLSMKSFPEDYIKDELKTATAGKLGMNVGDVTDEIFDMAFPEYKASDYYVYNYAYVTLKDGADEQAVKALLQNNIKSAVAVTGRDASTSVEAYQSEVEEGASYSGIFTFLFLFIAVLSVVTTMHRFVKKQRTQIGTLKALGFSRKRIERHYLGYGFYVSVIAAILGLIGGRFIIGNIFVNMEASYFEVPDMVVVTKPIVYAVAAGVVLLVTAATYFTCHGLLKESAAQTLRLEVPKVKAGELKPAGSLAKRFSVGVRWNLRDIGRNKGRTITGIVGIVGCTMLIVCAFGMRDTIKFFIKWQFEDLYNFEYKLDVESTISDEAYKELTDRYGDATSMTLAVEAFDASGNTSTRQIVVTDAGDKVRYTDHKAGYFELSDDGIYVSEKLLSILGLKVGDNVSWSVYGEEKIYTTGIAGTFREPQGQKLAMTRAYAESIGIDYKADCIYTDEDLSEVKNIAGVLLITGIAALKDGMMSMISMMDTVILLLMVVSVTLAVVIIYNLGILSFSEKQYQFATMKVLGFRSRQIRKIYVMQNLWICVVAVIIGLPLGEYMTALIYKLAMGDNYDMLVRVEPITYVVGAAGVFAVAYLVNLLLGRKVKTIDMVTSLKANE